MLHAIGTRMNRHNRGDACLLMTCCITLSSSAHQNTFWRCKTKQMLHFLSKTESASVYRQHEIMFHTINNRFAWELTLSHSWCSCVLLLLHMKLFVFTQLIMLDGLNHHNVMMDVLCSQNMIWNTNLNTLIFCIIRACFSTRTYFFSSRNEAKCLLLHAALKPIFSVLCSIIRKWHDYAWVDRNALWKNWHRHWRCVWNVGWDRLML